MEVDSEVARGSSDGEIVERMIKNKANLRCWSEK